MNIVQSLKRISPKSLWSLVQLSLKNPLYILPTLRATQECMHISTVHFGRKHMQNGKANAFRHALWNYRIAQKCTKWSKNQMKILKWTKSITDWHEEAFKNRDLAKLMDLHNNAVGRTIFTDNPTAQPKEIADLLLEKTRQSIKISNKEALDKLPDTLVYIID